jgi:choline transporter-like protein 2/4/5
MIPIWCLWIYFSVHLASIGTPKYEKNSYVSTMEYEKVIVYLFLFMLFGILWILAFLDAVEKFVIASTTCMWYFSGEASDNTDRTGSISLTMSFKWALTYHMGTMAFGAFLIATMNMIKIIFEYFA